MGRYLFHFFMGRIYSKWRGVCYGSNLQMYGLPLIRKHQKATICIGDNVVLTSLPQVNLSGIKQKNILAAPFPDSKIVIGNNVGISGSVIYAAQSIKIGSFVNIGVNTVIYDTDFHSLDYQKRRAQNWKDAKTKPVVIEDDVWIGANVTILKGVTIGCGAIVGAGSVVAKDIPPFTIWAGNPAVCIRKLESS